MKKKQIYTYVYIYTHIHVYMKPFRNTFLAGSPSKGNMHENLGCGKAGFFDTISNLTPSTNILPLKGADKSPSRSGPEFPSLGQSRLKNHSTYM